jgi:hypothetical protein
LHIESSSRVKNTTQAQPEPIFNPREMEILTFSDLRKYIIEQCSPESDRCVDREVEQRPADVQEEAVVLLAGPSRPDVSQQFFGQGSGRTGPDFSPVLSPGWPPTMITWPTITINCMDSDVCEVY